jgi:hypothetical protein
MLSVRAPEMLTAAQSQELANEYKSLALQPDIYKDRAAMLTNIARSLAGLATQLDKLAADMRNHAKGGRVANWSHPTANQRK